MAAKHRIILPVLFLLTLLPAASAQSIPLTERANLTFAHLKVNGKPVVMLLDTGASISLISPKATELSPIELAHLDTVPVNGLVVGGKLPITRITLTIGRDVFNADVGVLAVSALQDCDGILGRDILSQFSSVTIDYKNKTLNLERRN